MKSFEVFLAAIALLLYQVKAGYYGSCARDCIANLPNPNCTRDDFDYGWDCVCGDETALEGVNGCITSSCSSSDQNSIFADIAQACANNGNPITAVPAEATFSATSGGTLFGSRVGSAYSSCASGASPGNGRGKGPGNGYGYGWAGHCSRSTFTGNWDGWIVSWAGFGDDDEDCSTTTDSLATTATSPTQVSAMVTGTGVPSLGATVTTTISGQVLTGTIFSAEAVSTAGGSTGAAEQMGGSSRNEILGALGAMVLALVAALCMI